MQKHAFENVMVHQQVMACKKLDEERTLVLSEVTVNFDDSMLSVYRMVYIKYKDGSVYPLMQTFNPKEAHEAYKLAKLQ